MGQRSKRLGRRGFVLVELLVTLAIILILFVLYFSPGSKRYQLGRQELCQRNLKFIYMALQTYAADNRDAYPLLKGAQTSEAPLSLLVPRCTTSTEIFICPGSGDKALPAGKPFQDRRISYAYAMGLTKVPGTSPWLLSDAQVDTKPKAPGQALFSKDGKKPGNNHRQFGGNVLFADGRAETSPPAATEAVTTTNGVVALNPRP